MLLPGGPANTRCSVCRFDPGVLMCNSGRRQERVCRAQRPAAKINAIATSACDRDRTPGVEPAETPANCGLFVRDRETSVRVGLRTAWWWMQSDANPPQHANFPDNRE